MSCPVIWKSSWKDSLEQQRFSSMQREREGERERKGENWSLNLELCWVFVCIDIGGESRKECVLLSLSLSASQNTAGN
jgi:hypothetical protein